MQEVQTVDAAGIDQKLAAKIEARLEIRFGGAVALFRKPPFPRDTLELAPYGFGV